MLTIRNLEFAVRPTSVAVFGASGRAGSVGRVVMDNIVNGGFEGSIWPVNPRYPASSDLLEAYSPSALSACSWAQRCWQ